MSPPNRKAPAIFAESSRIMTSLCKTIYHFTLSLIGNDQRVNFSHKTQLTVTFCRGEITSGRSLNPQEGDGAGVEEDSAKPQKPDFTAQDNLVQVDIHRHSI